MTKSVWSLFVATAVLFGTSALAQNDSIPPVTGGDNEAPTENRIVSAPTATPDNIRRAQFATDVVEREPVDDVDSLATGAETVCFFTEIVNFAGGKVTHRWMYNGEVAAEITFDIGGPRWRVYSRKTLDPAHTGDWTVELVDGGGNTIDTAGFVYVEGKTQAAVEPEKQAAQGWSE